MNHPVPLSTADLLAVIDDLRERLVEGDSFEGFVQYSMPGQSDPPDADFMVLARYRIGNSMGQGGLRSVGSMTPYGVDDQQ